MRAAPFPPPPPGRLSFLLPRRSPNRLVRPPGRDRDHDGRSFARCRRRLIG